ncbi:pilus assembly PilX N-terminal domain-containing protein [Lysinibacillus sp. LZ02]|uniref:pilus assembly PilX N-terminal domain-containing protein n=1 Tax=Lysinibacillus sp. LZ02 TaxID=3420668 RepID=UPI003D367B72
MKYLNNKGYALFLTVLVIFLVSILGLSLLTVTANSNKTTVNERYDQSIYYVAEAGINLEKAKITEVLEEIYTPLMNVFNSMSYEAQKNILDMHGSFENYYYNEVKNQFCDKYNTTTHTSKCSPSNGNTILNYENSYHFSKQFNEQPVAQTTIQGDCSTVPCVFNLTSEGYFEGSQKNSRLLTQTLDVDINITPPSGGPGTGNGNGNGNTSSNTPISNIAAITNGNITLVGGATIDGNAGSLNGNISIKGGANITGTATLPSEASNIKLEDYLPDFPHQNFNEMENIRYPENTEIVESQWNKTNIIENGNFKANNWMTDNYKLTVDKDIRFDEFTVTQNNTITIDIGSNNVNLYVNSLDIQQGHIKIVGTGTLNIFVKDSVNIKGSFNKNNDDSASNQVNMFYQGTKATKFNGETQFHGSFYTNSADLKLTGGAGFYGNIYSGGKNLDISGGVPTKGQYIIAPHADLKLSGGGNITGTVIANSIDANGGTSINFGSSVVPLPVIPGTPTPPFIYQSATDFIKEDVLNEQ